MCQKKENVDMPLPCEQEGNIQAIAIQNAKILESMKNLSINQDNLSDSLKRSLDRLEQILLAEVENKKDIIQLRKESDLLFTKGREIDCRLDLIDVRNAKCDGSGIFKDFPKVWNWYQQEVGWRRFIPAAMTIITTLLAAYVTFSEVNYKHIDIAIVPDPTGQITDSSK